MKVLLVANVAREHVNKFHIPTIRHMRARGWRVDVACRVDEPVPEADHVYDMCWQRSPFRAGTFKGIYDLRRLIRQNGYDIVYCHTTVGLLVARLAALPLRREGLLVVAMDHGLFYFKGAPWANWLAYPVDWFLSHFTDEMITINREDDDFVRRHFCQKEIFKMTDGIGASFDRLRVENRAEARAEVRAEFGIPAGATVLIYVAELTLNKNQQMLIRALQDLRQQGGDYRLMLVGPDHADGRYQRLADEMGLQGEVIFTGWRRDIGRLMAAADVAVASSIREGLPINTIETLYCHLPVVAAANRGHSSIIQDGQNGFIVPRNDHQAMARRVEQLMADSDLYHRLASVDVSEYECDRIAEVICDTLEELKTIKAK